MNVKKRMETWVCEDMKVKAVLHGPALCFVQREQVSSTAVSYVRLSPRSTRTHSHNFPADSLPLSLLSLTPSLLLLLPSSFWAENSPSQFPISTSVSLARAVCALVMFCDPTSVEVRSTVFNLRSGAHLMCCHET